MAIIDGVAYQDDDWHLDLHMLAWQSPAMRPQNMMRFAHDIDSLNGAVDILVMCRTKRSWSEFIQLCIEELGIPRRQALDVLQFLISQGLMMRSSTPSYRNGVYRESVLKSAPYAVRELTYRIAHDGQPSPPKEISLEAKRQQARNEVNEALIAAGYHTTSKGRRLRVVR